MRPARRFALQSLAFALALGGVLLALKSQDTHADIGPYWRKLEDVRRQRPQTLFVGSSRTYRHVDPVLFDSLRGGVRRSGGHSYNFGLPGSRALETHYRVDRLVEMELPGLQRLVVEFGPVEVRPPPAARNSRRVHHYHDARRAALGARVALAADLPRGERARAAGDRWRTWVRNTFLVGWGRALANAAYKSRREAPPRPVGREGFVPLPAPGPVESPAPEAAAPEASGAAASGAGLREAGGAVRDRSVGLAERRAAYLRPEGRAEMARRVRAIRERGALAPTERDRVTAAAWLALADRARVRGVGVVFVEQPGTEGNGGVAALLREALGDGAVVSLNRPARHPALFAPEAWFDLGHLGAPGARRVTEILAREVPPLAEGEPLARGQTPEAAPEARPSAGEADG